MCDLGPASRVGKFGHRLLCHVFDPLAIPYQPASHAVPYRVAQAVDIVGDRRHAKLRSFQHAQPPALALGSVQVQHRGGDGCSLGVLGQVTAKPHTPGEVVPGYLGCERLTRLRPITSMVTPAGASLAATSSTRSTRLCATIRPTQVIAADAGGDSSTGI